MILQFVKDNWQILSLFGTAIAYLFRQIVATRAGVRALIRADIIRIYNKYHDDLEYCPIYVKDALTEEYREYHALKGNGVGTKLYEEVMNLPTEPPEKRVRRSAKD